MESSHSTAFRTALLLGAGVFVALACMIHGANASGMGTIIMQQRSDTPNLGKWTITTPNGRVYADHRGEHMEKIHEVEEGVYSVSIESPSRSSTFTVVYQDNNVIEQTASRYITFSVPRYSNIRVVMTHRVLVEREEKDFVSINLKSNPGEILPGGTARYTLSVSNLTDSTIRNLETSVQYDLSEGEVSGIKDFGTMEMKNLIVWNIPQIYAEQTWTTEFNYRASEIAKAGDMIAMSSRLYGQGLVESGMPQQHLSTKIGVTELPKTGWKTDSLIAGLLASVSLIIVYSIRRRQFVVQTV
ncbi:MAG: hypothetical protein QF809_00530 [Candidatus Peribacteraceae bacterium]|jgi:hypothetical protein|nr:hypothetical protein [Candidatus Peribacteraceae bacterium]MDP7645971.1 hypothetical protein [Candidatus Peribacteraceae bacterium]